MNELCLLFRYLLYCYLADPRSALGSALTSIVMDYKKRTPPAPIETLYVLGSSSTI